MYGNWLLDTTAALPLFGPHQLEVEDLLLGDPVVLGVDHGEPLVHGLGVGGHVVGHLGGAQLDSAGCTHHVVQRTHREHRGREVRT